jgi:NADPH:quinone reductase-like Zn-dependent oxidoreductase
MTVALNPTDYKMHANFPSPGAVAGCDFVGVVVAVGGSTEIKRIPNVRAIKLGDRVCAAVHGNNPLDHSTGTFAEYVRCEAELCLLVPPHMSWKEAAALGGIGYMTLGLALWHSEGLGLASSREKVTKENEGEFVLVYGGSTAAGSIAIQLLKLCVYTRSQCQ